MKTILHTAANFVMADGTRIECVQILNPDMIAVACLDYENGELTREHYAATVAHRRDEFRALAKFRHLTLYARQEPTTDETLKALAPDARKMDTVFYKDRSATKLYARIPWHHKNRPTSRRMVTLNCFDWRIEWI